MTPPLETFDAQDVLVRTRRRAARASRAPLVAIALTAVLAMLGQQGLLSWPLVGSVLCLAWVAATAWMNRRMRRLRRVVWCVKVTPQGITGYDYARRSIQIAWDEVRHVDLTDRALRVVRSRHCVMRVPARFGGFDRLARRIQREAQRRGAALWLGGRPLDEAPIDTLRALLYASGSSSSSDRRAPGPAA